MEWSWFDLAWPWIGLAAAAILVVLLFATHTLRESKDGSRWRDPVWLAWLMAAVYFVHNFEEYGIDALGHPHAFPIAMCSTLDQPPYPACPIPPGFYLAVNIAGIWVGSVLAAWLCRRNKAVGLSYAGLLITNGLSHVGEFAISGNYNPGVVTSILLFFPLFFWVVRACFGSGRMSYWILASIVLAGVILSVVLMGSAQARIHGLIGDNTLILIQIVNPIWFFLIPWLASRKFPDGTQS
jgi:hypothetical protein